MHLPIRLTFALTLLPILTPAMGELTIEYKAGTAYEMRVERTRSMTLGDASMLVGGEEFPADMMTASIVDREESETITLHDTVLEVEDGRPTRVLREFIEIGKEELAGEESNEESGVLEGMKIVLSLDDEGEVEAALEDEEADVDETYLTGHALEHPATLMMPEGSVEVGDSWTPSDEAIRGLLLTKGPEYYEVDGDDEEKDSLLAMLGEEGEYSATVTYKELVDLDGVECFMLEVEAELEAYIDELPKQLAGSGDNAKEGSIQVEGEFQAKLWIAVETQLPAKVELENDITFAIEMIMDHSGMAIEINIEMLVASSSTTEWDFDEAD